MFERDELEKALLGEPIKPMFEKDEKGEKDELEKALLGEPIKPMFEKDELDKSLAGEEIVAPKPISEPTPEPTPEPISEPIDFTQPIDELSVVKKGIPRTQLKDIYFSNEDPDLEGISNEAHYGAFGLDKMYINEHSNNQVETFSMAEQADYVRSTYNVEGWKNFESYKDGSYRKFMDFDDAKLIELGADEDMLRLIDERFSGQPAKEAKAIMMGTTGGDVTAVSYKQDRSIMSISDKIAYDMINGIPLDIIFSDDPYDSLIRDFPDDYEKIISARKKAEKAVEEGAPDFAKIRIFDTLEKDLADAEVKRAQAGLARHEEATRTIGDRGKQVESNNNAYDSAIRKYNVLIEKAQKMVDSAEDETTANKIYEEQQALIKTSSLEIEFMYNRHKALYVDYKNDWDMLYTNQATQQQTVDILNLPQDDLGFWEDTKLLWKTFATGIRGGAENLPAVIARAIRGGDISTLDERTLTNVIQKADLTQQMLALQGIEAKEKIYGLFQAEDLQQTLFQIPYSFIVMGATMGADYGTKALLKKFSKGKKSLIAGGIALLSGGTVSYRATKDQFVNDQFDLWKSLNSDGSEEEWQRWNDVMNKSAHRYGLWEAIPEAVGNLLLSRLYAVPAGKLVPIIGHIENTLARNLAGAILKIGATLGEEIPTETITAIGQGNLEYLTGLRDSVSPTMWGRIQESVGEILPQTIMTSLILGGAGNVVTSIKSRADGIAPITKNSIRAEKQLVKLRKFEKEIALEEVVPTVKEVVEAEKVIPEAEVEIKETEAIKEARERKEKLEAEVEAKEKIEPKVKPKVEPKVEPKIPPVAEPVAKATPEVVEEVPEAKFQSVGLIEEDVELDGLERGEEEGEFVEYKADGIELKRREYKFKVPGDKKQKIKDVGFVVKPNKKATKFTVYNEDGKKIARTKTLDSARMQAEQIINSNEFAKVLENRYNQLGVEKLVSPKLPADVKLDLRSITNRRLDVAQKAEKALEVGAMQEIIDVFKQEGVGDNQVWELIHGRRTLLEEVDGDIESAREKIQQSDLADDIDIARIIVNGKNIRENIDGIKTDVIKVWRTGSLATPIEERTETWVKAKLETDSGFSEQLNNWRTEYEESTGVKAKNKYDDGGNLEWFSTLAVDYTFGAIPKNKVHQQLRAILDKFQEYAQKIFKRAYGLNRFIEEGKVNPELITALTASIAEKVEPVQKLLPDVTKPTFELGTEYYRNPKVNVQFATDKAQLSPIRKFDVVNRATLVPTVVPNNPNLKGQLRFTSEIYRHEIYDTFTDEHNLMRRRDVKLAEGIYDYDELANILHDKFPQYNGFIYKDKDGKIPIAWYGDLKVTRDKEIQAQLNVDLAFGTFEISDRKEEVKNIFKKPTIDIEHHSFTDKIKTLNPDYYGIKGSRDSVERLRAGDKGFKNRVIVYVKGEKREMFLQQTVKYSGRLNTKDIYDLINNPKGYDQTGNLTNMEVEILKKYKGYMGIIDGRLAIAYFDKIPVKFEGKSETTYASPKNLITYELGEAQDDLIDQDINDVISRIVSAPKASQPERSWSKLYTRVFDDMHPIQQLVKMAKKETDISIDKDPYILARMLRGWEGVVEHFLSWGTLDIERQQNGESFNDIIKDAGGIDKLNAFLIATRAIDIQKKKFPEKTLEEISGFKDSVLKNVHKKLGTPEMKALAKRVYAYQDRILQFVRDSGLISQEQYRTIAEQNPYYVPFYRVLEDEAQNFNPRVSKAMVNVTSGLKYLKGSGKPIINPMESIIKNTYTLMNLALRNQVGQRVADLADTDIGKAFMSKEPTPHVVTDVSISELISKGIKAESVEDFENEYISIFRPNKLIPPKPYIFITRDGKREYYKLHPELYNSMTALAPEQFGMLMKILAVPATTMRVGATLTGEFMGRNVFRDILTATVYTSKGIMFSPIDFALGTLSLIAGKTGVGTVKRTKIFKQWKASGGDYAMLVSMDRAYFTKRLKEPLKSKWGKSVKYLNPLHTLRAISSGLEAGTRLGEFGRVLKKGADKTTGAGLIEAGYASREVTLDFSRKGAPALQKMNKITAFFNAQLQGVDKLARRFKHDPIKSTLRALTSITLPSIMLWLINHDDEDYQALPAWQKDLFWMIKIDSPLFKDINAFGDNFLRLPKPFELGIIFGSLPERVLDWIHEEDKYAVKEWVTSAREALFPDMLPTGIRLALEVAMNYNFFYEAPIVSPYIELQDISNIYKRRSTTTETAITVVEQLKKYTKVDISPADLDHLVYGMFAGLGRYVIDGTDYFIIKAKGKKLPPKVELGLADDPIIKGFIAKSPHSSSRWMNKFYNRYSKIAKAYNDQKWLKKNGTVEEAKKHALLNKLLLDQYSDYQKLAKIISSISKAVKAIKENERMSGDAKRREIDKLHREMTKLVRMATEVEDDPNFPKRSEFKKLERKYKIKKFKNNR